MATPTPLVRLYDLSGPRPWSPYCWCTRYALNYKGIPYTVTKVSFPGISAECKRLFPDKREGVDGFDATVPIIELLDVNQQPTFVLNESTAIAKFLNEKFTEEEGYRMLEGVEEVEKHVKEVKAGRVGLVRAIFRWIAVDIHDNALDANDGSKEFFRRTREGNARCALKDIMDVKGGGEAALLDELRGCWMSLRERMSREDGSGDREFYSSFVLCGV
jgi:hypothetical protein